MIKHSIKGVKKVVVKKNGKVKFVKSLFGYFTRRHSYDMYYVCSNVLVQKLGTVFVPTDIMSRVIKAFAYKRDMVESHKVIQYLWYNYITYVVKPNVSYESKAINNREVSILDLILQRIDLFTHIMKKIPVYTEENPYMKIIIKKFKKREKRTIKSILGD